MSRSEVMTNLKKSRFTFVCGFSKSRVSVWLLLDFAKEWHELYPLTFE